MSESHEHCDRAMEVLAKNVALAQKERDSLRSALSAAEEKLGVAEAVVEAARVLEPHSATLTLARRWAAFYGVLEAYDARSAK